MKQKIKQIRILLGTLTLFVAGAVGVLIPQTGYAATCGDVETSIIGGDICKDGTTGKDTAVESNVIWVLLRWAVNLMIAGVGVLAVAGIAYAAILYTSAGGNQEQVKKALGMITNVVIGVIAFGVMWALSQWLIPGGVFNGDGMVR